MKYLIFVFIAILMSACSTSTESDTQAGLEGDWNISPWGYTNISTTDNSLTFYGTKYAGSYSGTSFEGTITITQSGSSTKSTLNIKLDSDDKISGSLKVALTALGQTHSNTEYFTGTRK